MDHCESIDEQAFRREVRAWLVANRPSDPRPETFDGQIAYDRAWQRAQCDGGWAGLAWPRKFGGRGLAASQQLIWCEEYAAAGCPTVYDSSWLGLNHAGPTLIVRGTDAQKALHLPRILSGQSTWCQGFSEPNAGSDLASLRTRGVIDGDHLVVNGQKIWTSFGHLCDYQELLVRTGSAEDRHRGLTWVICEMGLPGMDVRPMPALDGHYHHCEVFYDNVRIPLSNVVGEINGGWSVAMTTFKFERGSAAFAGVCELHVALERLVDEARQPQPGSNRPAIEDDVIATRLGTLRARMQSLRALVHMLVSSDEQDVELGAEGMIMHLPFTELEQDVMRLAIDIRGPLGLSRSAPGSWADGYFNAFGQTIAGGTSEVQRNIIGERLLGLPR